ncbi:uncharacterized protein LOC126373325 [Pectinophora gossypiella]|uniref:uncharacterized protein LOC126373325 n=1 Tax=Pectinophora gossypiella TaxID=13191 RepID=UPI00214EB311|nr:uncharacterized protein LOC126373325 [Pectinophora gossypiella]
MKLLWCCLAALMTTALAGVDVEKTVKQVQTILQANSQLPRLSRDEIIQLLNDIRAEDAKSKSSSTEHSKETTTPYNIRDNEINPTSDLQDNIVADEKEYAVSVTAPTTQTLETSTKSEPSVMVVLPYTPRDGASLQELYTRPPRVEVVPESKVNPKPYKSHKIQDTLRNNAKLANQKKVDFPAELQAFLDSHGLKGKPGQDSFLLPLDGFKPLPPAKVVDGTVQLPENILLTYDLISPSDLKDGSDSEGAHSIAPTNFLYEPLRPEIPFELETSSSEKHKLVLPLDMPKSRKTKSTPPPTYAPIDYDAIKVIPLNQGPSPVEDERAVLESEQNKRQAAAAVANVGAEVSTSVETKEETTTASNEAKDAITNAPPGNDSAAADTDSGASISDLEDSFGGAAPEMPGDSELPPPKKNGFYWMLDWNSFLEVGDGDTKVNIRFEPKLGDPQMFLPVSVP